MGEKVSLTPAQAATLYILTTRVRYATSSQIAKVLGWSESHVRRVLSELRRMGLVDCIPAGLLGRWRSGGLSGMLSLLGAKLDEMKEVEKVDPRTKLHYATITFEQLKNMCPEIEKWQELAKRIMNEKSSQSPL